MPAETDEKAIDIINRTEPLANGGPIAPKRMKSLTRQGIYISPDDPAPKLAFVFPGQGSHYAGMGHELYENFPIIKQWMDRASDVAEFDILGTSFPQYGRRSAKDSLATTGSIHDGIRDGPAPLVVGPAAHSLGRAQSREN